MMPAILRWTMECSDCHTMSPDAPSSPEAQRTATEKGWLVGKRGKEGTDVADYCPECRVNHERKICQYEKKTGTCVSRGVYVITLKGAEHVSCGRHQAMFVTELFYGHDEETIEIRKIREP
jgi:hypothetical protein